MLMMMIVIVMMMIDADVGEESATLSLLWNPSKKHLKS